MSDQQPMVDERELHELFARRRPDPERFAAGVAERLRDRERGHGAALPKAAAWLPIPTGGTKIWFTLSLPILLLAGSWLALLGSAGIIRRALRAGPDAEAMAHGRATTEPAFGALSMLNPVRMLGKLAKALLFVIVAFVVTMAVALLGWPYLFDGIIATCVVSMFALAVLIRREARRGRADRAEVARLCVGMLEVVLILTIVNGLFGFRGVDSGQWVLAGAAVLAVGIISLVRFAPRHAITTLIAVGYLVALLQFDSFSPDHDRPVTQTEVERYVAEPDLGTHHLRLRHYASIVQSLRSAGHEVTPPVGLGPGLFDGVDLRSFGSALNDCARADLLPLSEWQRIAASRSYAYQLNTFVASDEGTLPPHYNEYVFRMLATRSLTDVERDRIVQRLIRNWPDDESRSPLADCRLIANALDWLGRSDLVDAEQDRVHAQLVRQQERAGWRRGGFGELPMPGSVDSRLPVDDIAMALIARFGLPPGLDLHALHQHLTKQSRVPNRPHPETRASAYAAFAQLQLLEARMGKLPARSLSRILIDERMLWAMIAMVLLCLYSVWLAPLQAGAQRGAMP